MLWVFSCTAQTIQVAENTDEDFFIEARYRPDDLQTELDDVLDQGLPSANDFWNLYQQLYDEGATPDCPGTNYNFDGPELTAYECYTDMGFQFEGFSEFSYEFGGWRLHLEGKILAPDGRLVTSAGSVQIERPTDDAIRMLFEGTFYSNFGAQWLHKTPSVIISFEGFDQRIEVHGGYSIAGKSLYFERFSFGRCDRGEGDLLIRDPSGGWWRYHCPSDCDEETALYFNDEKWGTFELDLSSLHDMLTILLEE